MLQDAISDFKSNGFEKARAIHMPATFKLDLNLTDHLKQFWNSEMVSVSGLIQVRFSCPQLIVLSSYLGNKLGNIIKIVISRNLFETYQLRIINH